MKSKPSLEVIAGGMYSGKTEELLRRIRRAQIAKLNVLIVKPTVDNRFSESEIQSHCGSKIKSVVVTGINNLDGSMIESSDVIAIDEGQFFGPSLITFCEYFVNLGKRIIVAGLDMDFNGHPFHPMNDLMAMADDVTKLKAICIKCGDDSVHSYKHDKTSEEIIQVGGDNKYIPLCRKCYKAEKNKLDNQPCENRLSKQTHTYELLNLETNEICWSGNSRNAAELEFYRIYKEMQIKLVVDGKLVDLPRITVR